MGKKINVTVINAFSSILLQIVLVISGFIIPKIILIYYGSSVNGLVSSLTQFMSFVGLVEGGVNSVVLASLYKPVVNNDKQKISSIFNTTKDFFNKLGIIFWIYTLLLAIIYPLLSHESFSFSYIFSLTFILGFTLFIQNYFSVSMKIMLNAKKKVYIVSFTQILLVLINLLSFITLAKHFESIHILKLITGIIYILQPIIYSKMVKKYFEIDKSIEKDQELMKNRWSGFSINLAAFIHYNTDATILTLFTNLKTVSVYSIFALVGNGLRTLILSLSSGIVPTIGQLYAKGNQGKLKKAFDAYELIIFCFVFAMFGVGIVLINPFVICYTKGITDANYNQPIFGVILLIAEAIYVLKEPYVELAYSANKFSDIKKHAYIEAGINIILSVLFVNFWGLIGVAIGTLIAMIYRTVFHVVYLKNNILNRKTTIFLKKLVLFISADLIAIIICKIINFKIANYIDFTIAGIIYSLIISIIIILLCILFYGDDFKSIIKLMKRKE